jgi:asparagine synthase (glutamine-hydrolysing)
MCGIVGIWSNNSSERTKSELVAAVQSLHHRGPDDSGTWANAGGVAFGFRRLSIVDLSSAGHQPMRSTDGRYVIVFNGEIYNHSEVRTQLEALGRDFVSRSDTEVILHAFDQWGSAAVERFVGMFAMALWDEKEQTLELVRDRVGVKPLYFGWHRGSLCFASELKALRAFRHWDPTINRQAMGEFLQYGYISEDRTIYEGVHKLLPGHRLKLKRGGEPIIEPYWSILDACSEQLEGSDGEIEEQLEAMLISAAKYRMVSDVPVGVYLSGGVDSSLVTAVLARHHSQPIRTFTIGFREDSHDESRWARLIAEHCGTNHRAYILEAPEGLEIAKGWGSLFDEPFGDSSGIPTLLISRLARQDVKVVLSADGGDELFSGYNVYAGVLKRLERLRRMPVSLRSTASALSPLASMIGMLGHTAADRDRRLSNLKKMLNEPTVGRLLEFDRTNWTPQQINQLVGGYESPRELADAFPGSDTDKMSHWDFRHYLPEDILTKVDRMTMAASLEGREPLLDHRLAELAFRLPSHLKRGSLGPKHILKSILYRYVPRNLVDRQKHGFSIPLDLWLRNELKGLVMDHLSESRIKATGLLDWKIAGRLRDDFYAGSQRLKTPLWYMLAFEMWREAWL